MLCESKVLVCLAWECYCYLDTRFTYTYFEVFVSTSFIYSPTVETKPIVFYCFKLPSNVELNLNQHQVIKTHFCVFRLKNIVN